MNNLHNAENKMHHYYIIIWYSSEDSLGDCIAMTKYLYRMNSTFLESGS